MNGGRLLIWPATILITVMIGAVTLLVVLGHSREVQSAGIVGAQGMMFLINFWVQRRSAKPTEDTVQHLADQPSFEDLEAQLSELAAKLAKVELTTTRTDKAVAGAIGS